jgi:hypothetical protein
MHPPFTREQFLDVFAAYNEAVWPAQFLAYGFALAILVLAFRPGRHSSRIVSGMLGFVWIWMGGVYHIAFFAAINRAAYVFGSLFILEGILLCIYGVLRTDLDFRYRPGWYSLVGGVFLTYALAVYPLLGYILGHRYPQTPSFGLAPCPTTIFTFGVLLLTRARVPRPVLVIPILWSLVGLSAALALGVYEDIGLVVAGVGGTLLLLVRDRKRG